MDQRMIIEVDLAVFREKVNGMLQAGWSFVAHSLILYAGNYAVVVERKKEKKGWFQK